MITPLPLGAHRGQRSPNGAHRTPDVGVVHGHRLVHVNRLDRSAAPDAGVVDEHVDGAMVGLDRADRGSDRIIIGDVELYHFDAEALGFGAVLQRDRLCRVAHGGIGRVAASSERQCRIQPNTRAAPGDQNNCHDKLRFDPRVAPADEKTVLRPQVPA
jgi:hypothetical protein